MRSWLASQFARPQGWVGRYFVAPWLDRISRRMNAMVLEALDLGPRQSVLEVGFGGGGLLAAMRHRTSGTVAGVDPSAAAVARARRRFRRDSHVRVQDGTAQSLPFRDAVFDRACSVNNLYFWPDPAAGFVELARVIRPGGRLVLAFEPPEELRKWPGHRFGFRLFSEVEATHFLSEAGFDVVGRREGTGRKPYRFLCLTAARRGGEAA